MIIWLWLGGALMAIGTVLSAFPGKRRRRPTDAVSARVPEAAPRVDRAHDDQPDDEHDEVPVGR